MKISKYILLVLLLFIMSCNEGISPLPEVAQSGFKGTVIFIGQWPENIARTHIVMFKETLEDSSDFNILNLGYISEEIPTGSTEYQYDTFVNSVLGEIEAREYAYLVVAQSNTESLSLQRKDWIVVGIYCNQTDLTCTGRINITPSSYLENINIICDFDNPPSQPPGGL